MDNKIGRIYGQLKVLDRVQAGPRQRVFYRCVCSCGRIENIPQTDLTKGCCNACVKALVVCKEVLASGYVTEDLIQVIKDLYIRNYSTVKTLQQQQAELLTKLDQQQQQATAIKNRLVKQLAIAAETKQKIDSQLVQLREAFLRKTNEETQLKRRITELESTVLFLKSKEARHDFVDVDLDQDRE